MRRLARQLQLVMRGDLGCVLLAWHASASCVMAINSQLVIPYQTDLPPQAPTVIFSPRAPGERECHRGGLCGGRTVRLLQVAFLDQRGLALHLLRRTTLLAIILRMTAPSFVVSAWSVHSPPFSPSCDQAIRAWELMYRAFPGT